MKILGLDTSTTSTGYCVMEDNKILAYGVIKPKKSLDVIDRIIYIEKEIKSIIKAKSVEYVCIEDLVSFRNAYATKGLAGLLMHIQIELRKKDMLVITVRPSEWRKGIVKGRTRAEQKASSKEYVLKNYGLDVGDDEADAILVARYGDMLEKE